MFGSDPYAAVVRVLRASTAGVTAAEIKQKLRSAGVPAMDRPAWDRLQRQLRADDHVTVEPGFRYRWAAHPEPPDAAGGRAAAEEDEARQRQALLDGVRALAELASEVEELTVNQASSRAMVHRVRSRVKLAGLEPIEKAGDSVAFDRRRHQPIGRPIAEGAPVTVVRPGYVWRSPVEEVLVTRAVVQE